MEENRSSQICEFNNRKEMRMNHIEDRLSGLLEPLLHHILSFMDINEVVHTSLISKRWRYLWTSVTHLNFNANLWNFNDYEFEREKLMYFVDTVLLLRDGSDIHSFTLDFSSGSTGDIDDARIDRWIAYAVKRHVRLLVFYRVDIPSARSFCLCGHVNTLELFGGSIPCDSKNELVLDFQGVENLTIDSCDHMGILHLIISAPKLKFLKLSHFFHEYNYKTTVKICAPNLLELVCKGYMYKDYLLENLSSLVTAEVDTQTLFPDCVSTVEEEVDTLTHFPDSVPTPEALFVRCVTKILQGLANVRSLIISAYAFQAGAAYPIICEKLDYLKLIHWCDSYDVGSIAIFLASFPKLETLVLQKDKVQYERDNSDEDQAAGLLSKPMFSHLKTIELHNFEGTKIELEFLEFLLKNAAVLNKVTIISIVTSNDKENQIVRFSEEIQALQKASPNISLTLNLRRR